MVPVEVISDQLERQGVKRFDFRAFLLGLFVGGLDKPWTEEALRRPVRITYPRGPRGGDAAP